MSHVGVRLKKAAYEDVMETLIDKSVALLGILSPCDETFHVQPVGERNSGYSLISSLVFQSECV